MNKINTIERFSRYVKLTNQLLFETNLQKLNQHTEGKWLIHGTKHRKDNQLQSLKIPCEISLLRI